MASSADWRIRMPSHALSVSTLPPPDELARARGGELLMNTRSGRAAVQLRARIPASGLKADISANRLE